jgi:hypothetical protein
VRLRRATVVATAALATPMLLAAAVGQVMLGRLFPDLVTPLVRRLYALDRLTSLTGPVETIPADLSGVALVTSPLRRS